MQTNKITHIVKIGLECGYNFDEKFCIPCFSEEEAIKVLSDFLDKKGTNMYGKLMLWQGHVLECDF